MEPAEALGIAAQVAVTLAGFAGVVVVFRPGSVHQWSSIDRFRLYLLLQNSLLPLAFSLFGIFLLTIKPPPEAIWRWCSALSLLFQVPGVFIGFKNAHKREFKGVSKIVFYPIAAIGMTAIVLQIYNIAIWNWFWPFFAGIIVHLIAAMAQFMRIVLLPPATHIQ